MIRGVNTKFAGKLLGENNRDKDEIVKLRRRVYDLGDQLSQALGTIRQKDKTILQREKKILEQESEMRGLRKEITSLKKNNRR
jgi:chromosome segregation ATPase